MSMGGSSVRQVICNSTASLSRLQQTWAQWNPTNFVASFKTAVNKGAEVMAVNKKLPSTWMTPCSSGSCIKPECEQYVGLWWVAGLLRMQQAGATVKWIELFNEPKSVPPLLAS